MQTAKGKESGGTTRLQEQFGYGYDAAWNLNKRTNNALIHTFSANNLNELTTTTRANSYTVAGSVSTNPTSVTVKDNANSAVAATVYGDNTFARDSVTLLDGNNTFTAIAQDSLSRKDTNVVSAYLPATVTHYYDARGNLTNDGRRVFYYDDENQLTSVTLSNAWRSEFAYDGMLRRRIRKEYTWQSSAWLKTNEVRYVYDGRLVVQERDANNLALVSYTRGNDLSGTMQGAGGIGGLLARTDNGQLLAVSSLAHAYYHADGNGNITALVNTNQLLAAKYSYDPYGNLLGLSGPLAEANTYRFSSKEYQANAGLYYYGFRYYEPNLQRWLNRDPLGEIGGVNLHQFAMNAAVGLVDRNGLDIWVEGPSDGEPVGHLSVCVGDPLGKYEGYSFAVNGEGILKAAVYKDVKKGGDITKYKKTTPEQDKAFKEKLDAEVGKKGTYCWDDICRTYSNRNFKEAPGKETTPPKRPSPPSTNPLHDRLALCSQSSIGDPVSSCTDSSTSSSTCSK